MSDAITIYRIAIGVQTQFPSLHITLSVKTCTNKGVEGNGQGIYWQHCGNENSLLDVFLP